DQIDDKLADSRTAPLLSVRMPTAQLLQSFPPPPVIQAVDSGRLPMPTQPAQKVIYEVQRAALHQRQDVQKQKERMATSGDMDPDMKMAAAAAPPAPSGPTPDEQEAARKIADELILLPRGQRLAHMADMPVDDLSGLRNLRPEVRDRLN